MSTPEIPVLERKVGLNLDTSVPDYQTPALNLAKSDTLLSDIGSSVAQNASNAMAEQLGYTAGLNPKGNLWPALTDFDKHFAETYHTQAQATLGLQAQQLFDTAHVQMSKATRLTPELIANTNKQLMAGLEGIVQNAPTAVRSKLELQFKSQLSTQNAQYSEKMFVQQREDEKENLISIIDTNSRAIYETVMRGDYGTAEKQLLVQLENIQNGTDNHHWDKAQGEKLKEQAKQDLINATSSYEVTAAHKAGKAGEYLKTLVDHKPSNLTEAQYQDKLSTALKQTQFLDSLVAQDQNLKSQQMLNQIATAPGAITQAQWDAFANSVSPMKAEQVKFHYIQALKKNETDTTARDSLIANWSNPDAQANADPKDKKSAFNKQVVDAMQNSHQTTIPMRSPEPLSLEQAQVQVATNAGGEIPVFTNILKNKLKSSNPAYKESGAQQIHALLQNGNGQALSGLNEQDWSMYSAFQSLRDSPDPIKAAQDAHNRIYNQDPEVEKLNNHKFQNILTKKNTLGVSNDNFALQAVGMSKSDFLDPALASAYGMNILSKLSNFYSISGDLEEAKASTQIWVDKNYGNTFINGGKHTTLHPIEKVVGFSDRDGVPYIQQDVIEQFNEKLIPLKKQYDEKKTNEYWEMVPVNITRNRQATIDELKKGIVHKIASNLYNNDYSNLGSDIKSSVTKTGIELAGSTIGGFPIGTAAYSKLTKSHEKKASEPTEYPSQEHGIFFKTYDPIKIKMHQRTANGEKIELFNVVLIGNAFGKYDIGIQTKRGRRNLYQEAPHLGISDYIPRKQKIIDAYNKDH
jgi:hypothetical protein